jgi:hypothetical protein
MNEICLFDDILNYWAPINLHNSLITYEKKAGSHIQFNITSFCLTEHYIK